MNILDAINNDQLFKPLFKDLSTWSGWFTLLRAFFGLPMGKDELKLFEACTGRKQAPQGDFKELWAIVGRRGGKSFISAVTAVFLALFHNFKEYLSPGESGMIQIIAADRAQA